MNKNRIQNLVFFFLLLIAIAESLQLSQTLAYHFNATTQLQALLNQQFQLQKSVNALVGDLSVIQTQVNAAATTAEKVLILQQAIVSQNQKLSQLEQSMIPPFNPSRSACLQLSSTQKTALLASIQTAKGQLSNFQNMLAGMPQNTGVQQLSLDLQKQGTIVLGVQRVLNSNCTNSSLFSRTVFQTNLLAPNWILGKLTMSDIVNQYYQRSQIYKSVNNCPLQTPFFDGVSCIKCSGNIPIFNIEINRCMQCPAYTTFNQGKRSCLTVQRYTNFSLSSNYALGGAGALPAVPVGILACPSTQPFWTGSACIQCNIPSYWDVLTSSCLQCPPGQVFDLVAKVCTMPQSNTLTYLFGKSRWVTSIGNLTNVLSARAAKVASNNYTICGTSTPYFDGANCINCPNEFSLKTKTCVSAAPNFAFDPNLHAYLQYQYNISTYPYATNYISATPLPITFNYCNATAPFFDGIACIPCLQPFPYFNVSSKKCVQCSSTSYYDSSLHLCVQRPILYVSNNFSYVMATSKMSLAGYKNLVYSRVQNHGNAIVKQCPVGQYSNFTACFPCPFGLYFNLQTQKCASCNGTINSSSLLCQPLVTMLTNLTAKNLILPPNTTIKTFATLESQVKAPFAVCPSSQPYSVLGLSCIACNSTGLPYFDLGAQKCVGCPSGLFYDSVFMNCTSPINVTNTKALVNYFGVGNYSIANVTSRLSALAAIRKTNPCPSGSPLALKNGSCVPCSGIYFVDLRNMRCVKGVTISNFPVLRRSKVIELGKATLLNLEKSQKSAAGIIPTLYCPLTSPLYNGRQCVGCALVQYYNLQGLNCYTPSLVTNVSALAQTHRYIQTNNYTISNIAAANNASPLPVIDCPSVAPLFNGFNCIACGASQYYDLQNDTCYSPNLVSNVSALNISGNFVNLGSFNLVNLKNNIQAQTLPTLACPSTSPLFNGKSCIGCPSNEYYNLKTLKCMVAHIVSNVAVLKQSGHVVQIGQYSLPFLSAQIAASNVPTQSCPASAPLFNGSQCVGCAGNQYYLIQTHACYLPHYSSNVNALNLTNRVVQVGNYTLAALKMTISGQAFPTKPCPSSTPFLSHGKCIACPLGQYYDLKTRLCYKPLQATNIGYLISSKRYVQIGNSTIANLQIQQKQNPYPTVPCPSIAPLFNGFHCTFCPAGQYFILSNYTCYKPSLVTNVSALNISKRYANYLGVTLNSINVSISQHKYPVVACPSTSPLFDGVKCIHCSPGTYYLLSNASCYTPHLVTNVSYLGLMKNYVEVGNATLLSLSNSINSSKLPVVACNSTAPVFNGKSCMACPNGTFHVLSNFTCFTPHFVANIAQLIKAKNYIEVGSATIASLSQAINTSKIPVQSCSPLTPVFNGVSCMACPNGTFYVLSNFTCYTPHFVTNVSQLLKAKNYIQIGNATLAALNTSINTSKLPVQSCNSSKPVFNGSQCVACPNGTFYILTNFTCYTPLFVSNVAALSMNKNLVQLPGKNISTLNASILASKLPVQSCPSSAPLFTGTKCVGCPNGTYYLLSNNTCYTPQFVSNVQVLTKSKNVVEIGNATVLSLSASINSSKLPVVSCPSLTPFFNGTGCVACAPGNFFLLSNSSCYTPGHVTNITELKRLKNYIQVGNVTLASISSAINASKFPVVACNSTTPVFNGKSCMACPNGTFYILTNFTCYTPGLVTNISQLLKAKNYIEIGNATISALATTINSSKYPVKSCNASAPLFDGVKCMSCPQGTFYILANFTCYTPLFVSNVTALSLSKNLVQLPGKNISTLNASILASKLPVQSCPSSAPLFTGVNCIGCPNGTYYLLSNNTCYTPHFVTNVKVLQKSKKYVNVGIFTLSALNSSITASKYPTQACSSVKPFFNGSTCIGCNATQYYNLGNKSCQNPNLIINIPALQASNQYIASAIMNLSTIALLNAKVPYPTAPCPSSSPLFNGSACISCQGKLYNLDNSTCISCPPQTAFNSTTHSCHFLPNYYPDLNLTTWIVSSKAGFQQLINMTNFRKTLPRATPCPPSTPNYNNQTGKCLSCPANTYWNYNTLLCLGCSSGMQVNMMTRQCATLMVGVYQTNLNAANLLYGGISQAQITYQHNQNKINYPGIQNCPLNTPYFDNFTCINCPPVAPLFNLVHSICTSCPLGSRYHNISKVCLSATNKLVISPPNVGKMYSSIF